MDIILRTGGNMVDFDLAPSRTALLNVDMQNCFVENSPIAAPDGLTILARVNRLAAACREAGVLVIHTSIVLRPDGSNIGIFGEFSPPAKGGILNKGTQSAALHPGLVRGERDILLDKPRFGAFHGTDLELILRSRGIDSVIISGVATNICCETTAREAAVRDFHVFFLSDGTATAAMGNASAEELQKATCATLGFLFAQVLTVEEMIAKIERAA
ncbi:MAG: cysteine hydrolase [Acidobacteriia bacterium]|nr:cysteine hydrolase [Terriglobia bacterium]